MRNRASQFAKLEFGKIQDDGVQAHDEALPHAESGGGRNGENVVLGEGHIAAAVVEVAEPESSTQAEKRTRWASGRGGASVGVFI